MGAICMYMISELVVLCGEWDPRAAAWPEAGRSLLGFRIGKQVGGG